MQAPQEVHNDSLPTPRDGDSPFLPGTAIQFAWDSTSLGWFKKCPRLYQYQMIEGWRGKSTGVDLQFGIWYHKGLELYDRQRVQNMDHETSIRSVVHYLYMESFGWEGTNYKNPKTLIRSVIQYLDQFGENDPARTVVKQDGHPAVEVSFRFELDWGPRAGEEVDNEGYLGSQPYLLCGHLDRVVDFAGGTYVMDRKTTKSTISDYYFDQFEPNTQMTLYTLAAKVILHTPIKGVIIDAVQVAVGFTRFARGFTYRTDSQLNEWLVDLRHTLDSAERCATEAYWPMNDSACFLCRFKSICSKDPAVREAFLESEFTKEDPWNPLKVR
jgi:hypothetical protein